MKNLFITFCLITSLFALNSCKKGNPFCVREKGSVVTETISTGEFSGIELELSATVEVTIDTFYSVQAEGYENQLDHLEFVMKNDDVLRIKSERCLKNKDKKLKIHITVPSVHTLSISSSGTINLLNTFYTDKLDLVIAGSGNITTADVIADELTSNITGSGNITTSGITGKHNLRITGSGNIESFNMVAQHAEVTISGSGTAKLTANQSLKVNITGSGDVRYKGSPIVETSISGSGRVIYEN